MRTRNVFVFFEKSQNRDCLDSFAQAHVVSQDTADSALIQTDDPVESDQLVILEFSALKNRRLFGQPRKRKVLTVFSLNLFFS